MAKTLALVLIGILAGANIVYFMLRHSDASDAAQVVGKPVAGAAISHDPGRVEGGDRRPSIAAVDEAAMSPAIAASVPRPSTPVSPSVSAPAAGDDKATSPAADAADALIVPVSGIQASQLVDTYTDARDSGRVHDAIDIMAAAGTPVLAAADGRVEKLFTSDKGGLTIYQFANHGDRGYYYAHLQRYAGGLAEHKALRQGEVIGYVGSTGNADPAAPHLHFEVFVLGPERQWWKTAPLNPYPLLGGR